MRMIYYAMGGGLGHLVRARDFLRTFGLTDAWVLTASEFARDPRVLSGLQLLAAPRALQNDAPAFRAWLLSEIARIDAGCLCVDTFPAGILGELCDLPSSLRAWHVARLMRWSEYAPRVPANPPHFERAWRVESLSADQDAFLAGHCARVEDLELASESLPPMAAGAPYWLVVHSGPASEVSELIAFACDVRASEGVRTPIIVITAAAPAHVPADTQVCDVFPAHAYFANAQRIFSAAGFNTMRDAAAYRFKHSVLPMPRRLDDQFERARRAFADRGRLC